MRISSGERFAIHVEAEVAREMGMGMMSPTAIVGRQGQDGERAADGPQWLIGVNPVLDLMYG